MHYHGWGRQAAIDAETQRIMDDESATTGDSLEYRSDGDRFRVTFGDGDDEPSTTVVTAVAAITGCKQDELDPLYYAIEPDALDAIFRPTVRGDGQDIVEVSFTYQGFAVAVKSDGIVEIRPTKNRSTSDEGST